MAHVSGKAGQVSNGSEITGIKSWTLDYNVDMLETTDFGNAGVKTFIAGGSGWSGSFEGFKDGAPEAIGASVTLTFYEVAAGTNWTGTGFLTGVSASASIDGIVSYSYTFQGTGALTPAAS